MMSVATPLEKAVLLLLMIDTISDDREGEDLKVAIRQKVLEAFPPEVVEKVRSKVRVEAFCLCGDEGEAVAELLVNTFVAEAV